MYWLYSVFLTTSWCPGDECLQQTPTPEQRGDPAFPELLVCCDWLTEVSVELQAPTLTQKKLSHSRIRSLPSSIFSVYYDAPLVHCAPARGAAGHRGPGPRQHHGACRRVDQGVLEHRGQPALGPMDGTTYGYGPEGAVKYWTANFSTSPYKSLKELILAKQVMLADGGDKTRGYTLKDDAKRVALPDAIKHSGFFHPGPCEVWCDGNKIAYDVDCSTKYATGSIPIDASKRSGADHLSLYWLAVHGASWQVYSDCVWLTGGKSSGGTRTGITPSVMSATPKATTTAPKTATATPVAGEATPSSTKKKCNRRRSRD